MVNIVAPSSCSICLEVLEGREIVNHGIYAHPEHAIHRECLLDWKRINYNRPLKCSFRCNEYYEDIAWDLASALRGRQCEICHLNLDRLQPHLGPILNHGGELGLRHRVHRECIRRIYTNKGSLKCPQHSECLIKFRANSVLNEEERDILLRKEQIRGLIGTIALGAILMLGFCFILVNACKLIGGLESFIDQRLTPNIKFYTGLLEKEAEMVGSLASGSVLFFCGVVSFVGLVELTEKISNYITERQPLSRQVLNVTVMGALWMGFAAVLIGGSCGVSTISGFVLIATVISGAVNGIFYAYNNRNERFGL